MKINITLRYLSNNYPLEVDTEDKIDTVCKNIEEQLNISIPQQILTFNDRTITEYHKEVGEIGLREGDVLYLKKRVTVKGEEKKPVGLLANPMVKGFLKNPDTMKNIVEMFPGFKEEMNENPELRSLIKSGNLQEEITNMTENPEYMNEQMKNYDLALSKLENMPGGFNMINGMLKDVQDPLSSVLGEGMRGGNKYKEGNKIESPITEPIPGVSKGHNHLLRYKTELAFLKEMGFENRKQNLAVLMECNGDLNLSVDCLQRMSKDRV